MLLAAVTGLCAAAGLLLVISGLQPRPVRPAARRRPADPELGPRVRRALAAGLPVLVVTRWPAAALAAAGFGWFSPDLFGSGSSRDRDTERAEAVAAWTEMLRDTMSGAHGLEETITKTAGLAPAAIRREVTALGARLEREPLAPALRRFADDLAHPTGDLVVAALTLAGTGAAGSLTELLGSLAEAARDEAGMRLRVEAARARLRTAVRVIAACTATTAGGLLLLNRSYLAVYDTVEGQILLALVAAVWAGALWWLARMGNFLAPERFLAAPANPVGQR